MNTKPLTLEEVSKMMHELSVEQATSDSRIQDFIDQVETAGKDILKSKEDAGEYIENASEFLCACIVAECIGSGDAGDLMIAVQMMKHIEMFKTVLGYGFIYSVGICATEELR